MGTGAFAPTSTLARWYRRRTLAVGGGGWREPHEAAAERELRRQLREVLADVEVEADANVGRPSGSVPEPEEAAAEGETQMEAVLGAGDEQPEMAGDGTETGDVDSGPELGQTSLELGLTQEGDE